MAYGELLGAACFVCMFVIGSILELAPDGSMLANTAVVRDVAGLLTLCGLLVPTLLHGLSLGSMLLLLCTYLALTGAAFSHTVSGACLDRCRHTSDSEPPVPQRGCRRRCMRSRSRTRLAAV